MSSGCARRQASFSGNREQFGEPHKHPVIAEAYGGEDDDHDKIVAQMRRTELVRMDAWDVYIQLPKTTTRLPLEMMALVCSLDVTMKTMQTTTLSQIQPVSVATPLSPLILMVMGRCKSQI